jgi:hypothetical protein
LGIERLPRKHSLIFIVLYVLIRDDVGYLLHVQRCCRFPLHFLDFLHVHLVFFAFVSAQGSAIINVVIVIFGIGQARLGRTIVHLLCLGRAERRRPRRYCA